MDYSKMGGGRSGANAPRYDRHKEAPQGKGTGKGKGAKASKSELLERMKAAQDKRKDG